MKQRKLIFLFLAIVSLFGSFSVMAVGAVAYGDEDNKYIPSILIVEDDAEAAELEAQGVIIWRRRADMALALVPRDMPNMKRLRGMQRYAHPRRAVPTMDKAREMFGAYRMHTGEGISAPYTGKGVVAGFCDTGFDPNHIAFLDSEGKSRVKRLVYYDEPRGIRRVIDNPDEIAAWTTDNDAMYHGTHVANIMAGSYAGAGYSGMAPGAEIVATTLHLYDAGILSACEDIIEYAKSVGKPAVINLSIGSYNGPHDGTTLFNRYLSLLGEEAIICIASGNEGNTKGFYQTTFSAEKPEWRVLLYSSSWTQFDMYGMTDAWSADNRPVGARLYIFDEYERKMLWEGPRIDCSEPFELSVSSESDAGFARYMSGEIYVRGYVNDLNGRWVTEVTYDTHTDEPNPASNGAWARYIIGLGFYGEPGVHANISADCQYTWTRPWPGYESAGSELSVSDIATGDNVVVVGMYNTRSTVPSIFGGTIDRGKPEDVGRVNSGSGYGTLIDGRMLPHTVAPGCFIVSACNSHFIEADPSRLNSMNAVTEVAGKSWYWATDAGTSMATPYVAGSIACWLEAKPTMTVDEVKRIIEATNSHDYPDENNPRHGHGWFNPYEGLRKVLDGADVTEVSAVGVPRLVINGDRAEIYNPGGGELSVAVYGVDGGQVVSSRTLTDVIITIDLSALDKGVYILTTMSENGAITTEKFIRP